MDLISTQPSPCQHLKLVIYTGPFRNYKERGSRIPKVTFLLANHLLGSSKEAKPQIYTQAI